MTNDEDYQMPLTSAANRPRPTAARCHRTLSLLRGFIRQHPRFGRRAKHRTIRPPHAHSFRGLSAVSACARRRHTHTHIHPHAQMSSMIRRAADSETSIEDRRGFIVRLTPADTHALLVDSLPGLLFFPSANVFLSLKFRMGPNAGRVNFPHPPLHVRTGRAMRYGMSQRCGKQALSQIRAQQVAIRTNFCLKMVPVRSGRGCRATARRRMGFGIDNDRIDLRRRVGAAVVAGATIAIDAAIAPAAAATAAVSYCHARCGCRCCFLFYCCRCCR